MLVREFPNCRCIVMDGECCLFVLFCGVLALDMEDFYLCLDKRSEEDFTKRQKISDQGT